VDLRVWMRDDAERSPERAFYQPSRHSAGKPIVAGWAYQLVAQLGPFSHCWGKQRDRHHGKGKAVR
jgi:hypothetical protein